MSNFGRLKYFFLTLLTSVVATGVISFVLSPQLPEASLKAQHGVHGQQQFYNFTLRDGLSQGTVRSVIQDSRGFMWIGTSNGLNRFDGFEFKTYTVDRFSKQSLNNQWINDLVEAPDGTIWIGTNGGGINRYHPESEQFTQISDTSESFLDDERIISMYMSSDSVMWIGTFDGLSRYDLKRKQFIKTEIDENSKRLENTLVHEFLEDPSGRVWIISDEGLYLWDKQLLKIVEVPSQIENNQSDTENNPIRVRARSLVNDDDGRFWLGTRNNGVFSFTVTSEIPEKVNLKPFTLRDQMNSDHINDLIIDDDNHLWIASARGVYHYASCVEELHTYIKDNDRPHGFNDQMAITLFLDDFQNLWVGAQATGLYLSDLQPERFQLISQSELGDSEIHRDIWTMLQINNQLFIGSRAGIIEMKSAPASGYNRVTSWAEDKNITHIISDSQDSIWAGVFGGGLAQLNIEDRSVELIKSSARPLESRRVLQIHAVGDSLIFAGTTNGLFEYNRRHNEFTRIPLSTSERRMIYSFEDNGRDVLWVGTDRGLFEYSLTDKTIIPRSLRVPGQVNDIENEVNAISYHSGFKRIYAGTNHGLIILPENTADASSNYFVGSNLGLSDQLVLGMALTIDTDELWLSTSQTLYKINLDEDGLTKQIQNIGEQTQFRSNEFNAAAYERADNGTLLFGGVNGVTYFNPRKWVMSDEMYPVHIYQANIESDVEIRSLSIDPHSPKKIEINPGERSVEFRFNYPDLSLAADQMFYYKIKSEKTDEQQWESIRGERVVKFSNLQPGNHEFSISAHPPQYENRVVSTVSLTVLPHFWQTRSFRLLLLFFILTIGFWVMRRREKRLQSQKNELRSEINKQTRVLEATNEKLKHSEELFRSITENVADTVVLARPDGLIRYCSPSVKQAFGYKVDEVVGTQVLDYIHPDDHHVIIDMSKRTLKQNRVLSDVYRMQNKNGEWRKYITSGSGIRGEDGEIAAIVSVSRDVTEQMKIQELTEQAKESAEAANRAKSNFLAGISHELRTPLNAILGYSRLLYEDEGVPERQRSYAETMYKSGDHLLGMINEILDLSKIESGKMDIENEAFNLSDFLRDIHAIFKLKTDRKSIDLKLKIPHDLPEIVVGDVSKLRQIMINLIGNAVKYTENGTILIYCTIRTIMNEHITVELGVRDTGIGIPENQIDSIFEPFRQVEGRFNTGTGLGLALTQKFTELLSGHLLVDSSVGEGTDIRAELTFRLGNEYDEPARNKQGIPLSINDGKHPEILIIDDIETNAQLINDLLTPVGFSCRIASNGLDGLKEIYSKRPDLVLMDLRMPEMSGEDVLEELRNNSQYSELPVVAVTATGFLETSKNMIDLGFNDLIFKPLDTNRLFSILAKELNLKYTFRSEQQTTKAESKSSDKLTFSLSDVDDLLTTLSEDQRQQFKDACMLTDFDQLKRIVDDLPDDLSLKKQLLKIIDNNNYKALLMINDHLQNDN